MKNCYLFLFASLWLFMGCHRSSEVVLSFTCEPEYAADSTWAYIYRLRDSDYHIADSCLILEHRFEFRFDVPFEERYTLLLPTSRVKLQDIVLRPGERYKLHIPAPNRFRYTYVLTEALDQSPASRAYFHREQEGRKVAAVYRAVKALRDSLGGDERSETWRYWNDSLQRVNEDNLYGVSLRLSGDSLVLTSPYTCYSLLSGFGRELPQFDSILLAMKQRFPGYPLFDRLTDPVPMSREGWRNEVRIKELLGLPAPPPYVEPVKDTIPEPTGVRPFGVGDCIADLGIRTTEGVVRPFATIATDFVLVDFWASWCQPCRTEIERTVHGLSERYSSRLTVCAISLDRDEKQWKDAVAALGTQHFAHYRLAQPHADYKLTMAQFKVSFIPYTVLLDRQRKIVAINLHGDELVEKIEELVAHR